MAALRVRTTRHCHTERSSGLLTYPYLPEIMTGREGTGAKDLQSLPREKGSASIAREQSHNSPNNAAPEGSQRPPLQPHAKGGEFC